MPNRVVHILGVPLDHGAGRRGVGMGPSAIRMARLHETLDRVGWKLRDLGDIHVDAPETQDEGSAAARYLPLVARVCAELTRRVYKVCEDGGMPLVIGGDHSIAIGTMSGLAAFLRDRDDASTLPPRVGVLWFDAHADINTPESSPSGNIHGMPLACLLGKGPTELTALGYPGAKLDPARVCQIGLRDIDDVEKRLVRESGVHAYTMADIDKRGMYEVMREAIAAVCEESDWLHVTFDIDALDPRIAPGTGTRKIGGLTYREAHLALEMVADSGRLNSFEMVEVNPILDDRNATAELAVGLIGSAFGKRIL